jgi:RND family efflux transporter MFP subunit
MKTRLLLAGLCLPCLALAEAPLIKFSPAQAKAMAIVSQSLGGFAARGERQLPAQVVVPPGQMEVVAAPLAGMLTAVAVAHGEPVRRGQVLARLQGSQLLELQREVVQAASQAELTAEAARRDESLFAEGIIAGGRLAASRAGARQAAAQLAEKRAALRLAGLAEPDAGLRGLAGQAELRAPADGVVLEAAAQPGQRVEAGTLLFRLARLSPLWLEIQASPEQAAGLRPGDAVQVPGCADPARLTLVAPHLDAATQSLRLRAELPRPAGCVRPYQFLQVRVQYAQPKGEAGHWRLPVNAVARHQDQSWLFAEVGGGFRPVPVKVLEEAEKTVLVAADLGADTKVVVQGLAAVKAAWLGLGAGEAP